jgi:ATP-dependent helicase HrpB
MIGLPIDCCLPQVLDAVKASRTAIVVAPPGAGKTTRVPPALLDSGVLTSGHDHVILLQPRRVAARAAAARMAFERGSRVGDEVGHHVRFDRVAGPKTRLLVVTEGLLTRRLMDDPFLEGVGAIVLDEFHERSLHADLALALVREIQRGVRPDLALVVMSATLDASSVSRYLGDAPIIESAGQTHPVEITHDARPGTLSERVSRAVSEVLEDNGPPGDVLVFLPGFDEIHRCARAVEALARRLEVDVLPLHGSLRAEDQDRAIRPSPRRKLVLATNVAETSLTIDGVSTVVDGGLVRRPRFDPDRGLDRLELVRASRASIHQRAGRAGRTGPGRCIRLWAEREDRGRAAFDEPEVQRVDLSGTSLTLHSWGCADPRRFDWYESPPEAMLDAAEQTLRALRAIDHEGRITGLGRDLARLPVAPRLGRLVLGAADLGLAREGAALAALLEDRDILVSETVGDSAPRIAATRGDSDLLIRLDHLEGAERGGFAAGLRTSGIDPAGARRVSRSRDALLRLTRPHDRSKNHPNQDRSEKGLLRLLLQVFPDRVARRRDDDATAGLMVGGRGVKLDAASVVRDAPFYLALAMNADRKGRAGARNDRVSIASAIERDWLFELFPESIATERIVRFDEKTRRVTASVVTRYRDLVIDERLNQPTTPEESGEALADGLADRVEEIVRSDPGASSLLDRLACLTAWRPDLDLPEVDADALMALLRLSCHGLRSEDEVRRSRWGDLVAGFLAPMQKRALDELAPATIEVPSGSRIKVVYEPGRPPVLAVRIQELFGWSHAPMLAGGRVRALLHLLGPNHRPVQVTDDLASFWANTYQQVRKDLRARYPRHAWPDDPTTARAEAKGGRRTS